MSKNEMTAAGELAGVSFAGVLSDAAFAQRQLARLATEPNHPSADVFADNARIMVRRVWRNALDLSGMREEIGQ